MSAARVCVDEALLAQLGLMSATGGSRDPAQARGAGVVRAKQQKPQTEADPQMCGCQRGRGLWAWGEQTQSVVQSG